METSQFILWAAGVADSKKLDSKHLLELKMATTFFACLASQNENDRKPRSQNYYSD